MGAALSRAPGSADIQTMWNHHLLPTRWCDQGIVPCVLVSRDSSRPSNLNPGPETTSCGATSRTCTLSTALACGMSPVRRSPQRGGSISASFRGRTWAQPYIYCETSHFCDARLARRQNAAKQRGAECRSKPQAQILERNWSSRMDAAPAFQRSTGVSQGIIALPSSKTATVYSCSCLPDGIVPG